MTRAASPLPTEARAALAAQGLSQFNACGVARLPMIRKTEASLTWMLQKGTFPRGAMIGGRMYWRESDVLDWINAQFEGAS